MTKKHIGYLDYCRAIGALVIVTLHSGIRQMQFGLIFVMSMFFMVSGFVYVPEKYTHKEYIKRRFKRLIIPFWTLTAMYSVVEVFRSLTLGYGSFKNLLAFLFVFGYAFLKISGLKPQLDGWLLGFIPPTPVTTAFLIAESFAIVAIITLYKHPQKRL